MPSLRHPVRALVPAIVALMVSVFLTAAIPSVAAAIPPTGPVSAALLGQTLTWSTCHPGQQVPQLKCAAVKVPLDWANPTGKTIAIEISRISASDPAARHGVLFTNPGGPGEPGLDLPLFIPQAEPSIAAAYDLIGMDVRGVGESRPVLHCASTSILERLYNLNGRDASRTNQATYLRLNREYGQKCSADPFTRYINYAEIVRDMDLVRQLLGESKISYLGFSGGTQLGAWYASVFPQNVDRFVLDGNNDWTSPAYGSFVRQARGFQNVLDSFLEPWIAEHHRLFHLGKDAGAVAQTYERRRAALVLHPLKITHSFTLTAAAYDSGITGALYNTSDYQDIATALSAIERFKTATAHERKLVASLFGGNPGLGQDAFWAIECQNDQGPSWATIEADTNRLRAKYPLIGATWNAEPCPFFTTPITGSPVQPQSLPSLLMLANSDDPATPLAGALIARSRTPNARLVTVLDEPDHTIYGYGDKCADGYANRWLLDGVLPSTDAICHGVPLPTPETKSNAKLSFHEGVRAA